MTPPFRPERLVLTSSIAAELALRGEALARIEHFEDGSATLTFEPSEEPAEHAAACDCAECHLERRLWHSFMAEDGECKCAECAVDSAQDAAVTTDDSSDSDCDCPDCADDQALIWQRQRLIARLKGRLLQLGGRYVDELHPWGRCLCGGADLCGWCESTCQSCGGDIHEGDCPEFPNAHPQVV